MEDYIKALITVVVIVSGVVGGVLFLQHREYAKCEKQYGHGYRATGGSYSPVVCVSETGEGKYLR